jgi:hypothetical protein
MTKNAAVVGTNRTTLIPITAVMEFVRKAMKKTLAVGGRVTMPRRTSAAKEIFTPTNWAIRLVAKTSLTTPRKKRVARELFMMALASAAIKLRTTKPLTAAAMNVLSTMLQKINVAMGMLSQSMTILVRLA